MENEIVLHFALDKSRNEATARKRLPGAIMDRLLTPPLQASRSWPGDGKDTKKDRLPALLVRFVRDVLQKCGESNIDHKMDKRISVRITNTVFHNSDYTEDPAYSDTLGTWQKCHCNQRYISNKPIIWDMPKVSL